MLSTRGKTVSKTIGTFAAAYAVAFLVMSRQLGARVDALHTWWWKGATNDWPVVQLLVDRLGHATTSAVAGCVFVLLGATAVALLGFAARTVVRARVRAGNRDPLAAPRMWMAAHPSATRALTAIPAALAAAWVVWTGYDLPGGAASGPASATIAMLALWGIPAAIAAIGWTALTRAGVDAMVAPVVDEADPQNADVAGDEISFDAVAVTHETRAAVGAMMALTAAMVVGLASVSTRTFFHDPRVMAALVGYVVVALGGAALFRRASRIAIGLDGVFVTGSSRTRFFAYRDLDYAHPKGDDIVLVRGPRVALRLQLHGSDAARREAVLERLRGSIQRAREERRDPTTDFVNAASREVLTRAAHGAGDYRATALSAEQLWSLVEGPSIESTARCTAAAALVASGGPETRARLRVAAEQCADPRVRVELQNLCVEDEIEVEHVVLAPPRVRNL